MEERKKEICKQEIKYESNIIIIGEIYLRVRERLERKGERWKERLVYRDGWKRAQGIDFLVS